MAMLPSRAAVLSLGWGWAGAGARGAARGQELIGSQC